MTNHVTYDPVVFFTDGEYKVMSSQSLCRSIQELVEQTLLYMLCMSSSSLTDQLGAIGD